MVNPYLYDLLGVDTEATAEEIKEAYHDLAKEHHPDAGGDTENFKKVSLAYAVLKDAKSRKRYDLEGTFDGQNQDDVLTFLATARLSALMDELVRKNVSKVDKLLEFDLIEAVKNLANGVVAQCGSKVQIIKKAIEGMGKVKGCYEHKGVGKNVVNFVMDNQIATLRADMAQNEREIQIAKKVISILDSYEFHAGF